MFMDHHFEKMEQLLQLNTKMKGVYVESGNKGLVGFALHILSRNVVLLGYQHMYDDTFLLKIFRAVWIHAVMEKKK